jgi:hypothetical protein
MESHKKFKRPTMAIPPLRKPDFSWTCLNMEKSKQFAQHLQTFSHYIPGTITMTKLKPI